MSDVEHKVLGVFAYLSPTEVVCTSEAACVIAGSEQAMRHYLAEVDPSGGASHTIRKTRCGEVLRGLRLGGAYAFDRESYSRFYPLAIAAGLPVSAADFAAETERGNRFFTICLVSR